MPWLPPVAGGHATFSACPHQVTAILYLSNACCIQSQFGLTLLVYHLKKSSYRFLFFVGGSALGSPTHQNFYAWVVVVRSDASEKVFDSSHF
jgi:hypothetical protein